ncbi:hypothetical protein PRK78_005893 [Emydomyces testavorans]|uniref:Uncharacterized protein n=1 Tax=Emydomyces testavorans TaxID=2070801 RepID=A0AAF0DL09_9EURO|nr:hypothetical protein PRK78_005893 [Emydomyces testavorans]
MDKASINEMEEAIEVNDSSADLEKALSYHDELPARIEPSDADEQQPSESRDDIEERRRCSLAREAANPIDKGGVTEKTLPVTETICPRPASTPPPDGGFEAWLQAGLAHLAIFNTWGYINSLGMFQDYYTETLQHISWVGSVQLFLLFAIGTFSGRATDAGYFKSVWGTGAVIIMLSVFLTSFCKHYWQLFLVQGLFLGIGSGLVFCPTVALLSTYFSSRRSLALAIGACGTATGGIIFPLLVQRLLPNIGFPWTMRVLALLTTLTLSPGFLFFRQRTRPRRRGPLFEWRAFTERPYTLYAVAMFLNFWALYFGFFYLNSFARGTTTTTGVSPSERLTLLMIMNSLGTIGRLLPNALADYRTGPLNTIIPCTLATTIMLFAWTRVRDSRGLYAFAILYGFFGAGVQALFPAVLASLSPDPRKTGVRFGMVLSIVSVASLTGPPIAGALIQRRGGDYFWAQMFAGVSMLVGTGVLVMARCALTGWKWRVKV